MSCPASGSWPAEAEAVGQARRLVCAFLRQEGQDDLVDDAGLLVTELATNVVLHVGGSFAVQVTRSGPSEVVIEVSDGSTATPLLRSFSPRASTGRGMRLVHSLSAEHGVRLGPDGKTVWVRLTSAQARRDEDEILGDFAEVDWTAMLQDGPEPWAPEATVREREGSGPAGLVRAAA